MSVVGHIRLIGEDHAMHHHGTVLSVVDNPKLTNLWSIYREEAHTLIERGRAEWIGGYGVRPGVPMMSQADRQLEEHADMLARHAKEHREMMERHEQEIMDADAEASGRDDDGYAA